MATIAELPKTYPMSDLRTRLGEIEAEARETQRPILLTRNGTSSLVVMDSEAFNEHIRHERAVRKLREAEIEERYLAEPIAHDDVKTRAQAIIDAGRTMYA